MPMTPKQITDALRAALPDATIDLKDLAGDNEHYQVTVVSPSFAGKTRVQQHKMVYDALGGSMGTALHALSVTTKAE